jgi:serine/threonine protein kinase/class 3 adenylate cyclase
VYLDAAGVEASRGDPFIGRLLDRRFALLRRIAVGGMGALYEALQLPVERAVAVKVIRPELLGPDADAVRARFRREARAVSRLKHPHTVTLFDFGETASGELFMAMEFIEGQNLEQALRDGPFAPERAVALVSQAAQALEEAHRLGVVHRDLKPANIMLAQHADGVERVKVVDFGIARLLDIAGDQHYTLTGKISGTPHYMSPEVVRGGAADHRSDIYALGLILFRAVAGRPPFEGSPIQVVLAQMNDPPPRLADVVPGVDLPPGLQAVIDRALEKRPDERYASATDFRRALDAVCRRGELGALWAEAGQGAGDLFAALRSHGDRLVELVVDEVRTHVAVYRFVPPSMLIERVRFYVQWCLVTMPDEDELVRYLDQRWRGQRQFFARLPDLLAAFSSWFPALRRLMRELGPEARDLVERHMATLERHVWLLLRFVGARYEELRMEGGEAGTPSGRLIEALQRAAGPAMTDDMLATDSFTALSPRESVVTVVAARLVDASTGAPASAAPEGDPARFLGALRRRRAALRDAVTRRGGVVQSHDADAIVVVFGAPFTHEDDAASAVRGGLEAVAEIDRLAAELPGRVRVQVGVATGPAFAGNAGSDERPEYVATGAAVVRACALRDAAAPGEVVADAVTGARADVAPCGAFRVAGG